MLVSAKVPIYQPLPDIGPTISMPATTHSVCFGAVSLSATTITVFASFSTSRMLPPIQLSFDSTEPLISIPLALFSYSICVLCSNLFLLSEVLRTFYRIALPKLRRREQPSLTHAFYQKVFQALAMQTSPRVQVVPPRRRCLQLSRFATVDCALPLAHRRDPATDSHLAGPAAAADRQAEAMQMQRAKESCHQQHPGR